MAGRWAAPLTAPPSAPAAAAPAGPTAAELAGYSRRQRAYLGADPQKYKHFKPALSRRERGSFADASVAQEFEEEVRAAAVAGGGGRASRQG